MAMVKMPDREKIALKHQEEKDFRGLGSLFRKAAGERGVVTETPKPKCGKYSSGSVFRGSREGNSKNSIVRIQHG